MSILHTGTRTLLYLFAAIGFVLVLGFIAVEFGWTNVTGTVDSLERYKEERSTLPWAQGEEWEALHEAIIKDEAVIKRAAVVSGVPARTIVALLVPEQLRLFHSEREIFKSYFGPLKILGNQTQFSWGVMGFKPETARLIERHLKDQSSPYYLGKAYENLLDVTSGSQDAERFNRIANEDDHYYAYLYAGLYVRQIEAQWERAGYPITDRPEILATLYNIGFENSEPKENPQIGGAEIEIGDTIYSFGGLAYEFYYSAELQDRFPL